MGERKLILECSYEEYDRGPGLLRIGCGRDERITEGGYPSE